jgi:ATP-dependent Clp protease ATP-binding subunit ClpB
MSEYMEKHSVSRLIGSPPGYVGYEQGGFLTEAVRRRPYQVILFDEVEKANQEIFNVLLQVLDDGRLTDGQGRVVDFTNTIIVMTSNLGASYINSEIDEIEARKMIMNELQTFFRPEFINRIDEIIFFNRLKQENMEAIVKIQLSNLVTKLLEKGIELSFDKSLINYLAKKGFDPIFGARPLKRIIQNEVQNQLANAILSGSVVDKDKIIISYKDDVIKLVTSH